MKKITFILAALFVSGSMIMAQGGPHRGKQKNMDPKARAERMTERMVKEYSLNDTQKQQLYDVNLAMTEKMMPPQGHRHHKNAKMDKQKCCENCTCNSAKEAKKDKKDKIDKKSAKQDKRGDRPSKEDKEKMIAEMKKSREEYDAKVKGIFTKDQYEKYTQNQAERQKRMGERRQKTQRTNS